MLPDSLRNTDKRRNGPEFPNDTKKRKVEDKDSSQYVRMMISNDLGLSSLLVSVKYELILLDQYSKAVLLLYDVLNPLPLLTRYR